MQVKINNRTGPDTFFLTTGPDRRFLSDNRTDNRTGPDRIFNCFLLFFSKQMSAGGAAAPPDPPAKAGLRPAQNIWFVLETQYCWCRPEGFPGGSGGTGAPPAKTVRYLSGRAVNAHSCKSLTPGMGREGSVGAQLAGRDGNICRHRSSPRNKVQNYEERAWPDESRGTLRFTENSGIQNCQASLQLRFGTPQKTLFSSSCVVGSNTKTWTY